MTLGDIVRQYREEHGVSQREFARRCGLSNAYISMLEMNRNTKNGQPIKPTLDAIRRVSEVIGRDMLSILKDLGETEISLAAPLPANAVALKDIPRKRIPVLGVIAAGAPIMADREYDEAVYVDADSRADFAIRVEGDSMVPLYQPGDLVYFREQDCVDNGQIAAVLVDGSTAAALKHFYYKDGVVTLASENPRYAPMVFPNPSDVRVLGVPVGFQRMY